MEKTLQNKLLAYLIVSALTFLYLITPHKAALSVPLFIIVQAILLYFVAPKKAPLLMMIPIFILSLNYFISASNIWRISNFFVIVALYGVMTLLMHGKFPFGKTSSGFIFDIINKIMAPFPFFNLPVKWSLESNKEQAALFKRILTGVVIALPCLIILVAVLASADEIFSKGVTGFMDYIKSALNFWLIVKIIFSVAAGFYLFGLAYSAYQPHKEIEVNFGVKNSDALILNIVLFSILAVYTVFAIIQFRYLFASGASLPYGLTYTYYARRGFFELLFLSGVNICIILFTVRLIQGQSGAGARFTKALCCYLCLMTCVLLISSYYRMWLYNDGMGLTRLRYLVFGFLYFEAVGLVFTFVYILKPKFNIIALYLILGLIYYLWLNLVPMDAVVAKDQIDRYLAGKKSDITYVLNLSADAAGQISRLLGGPIGRVRNDVQKYFKFHNKQYNSLPGEWQRLNWSQERCLSVYEEATARYAEESEAPVAVKPAPQTNVTTVPPAEVTDDREEILRYVEQQRQVQNVGNTPPGQNVNDRAIHDMEPQLNDELQASRGVVSGEGAKPPAASSVSLRAEIPDEIKDALTQGETKSAPDFRDISVQFSPGEPGRERLTPATKIFAAEAHDGQKLGWQMYESGHEASLMEITVNAPGEKVALVLGAQESTVWHVSWTEGTEIVAVLLWGRVGFPQEVAGLPADVPVDSCYFRSHDDTDQVAQKVWMRDIDETFMTSKGQVVAGSPLTDTVMVQTMGEVRKEDFMMSHLAEDDFSISPETRRRMEAELALAEKQTETNFGVFNSGVRPETGKVADIALPPDEAKIYATGAYNGQKLGWQIDDSGHEATLIKITVNEPGEKVALVLGAYEPTVWHISWTEGTEITTVLAGGYHALRVVGLPAEVPVITSSYEEGGPFKYFYISSSEGTGRAGQRVRELWKRDIDEEFKVERDEVLMGRPLAPDTNVKTMAEVRKEDFVDPDKPLAGVPGLEEAVRKGLLREATGEDMRQYLTEMALAGGVPENVVDKGIAPRDTMSRPRTYVVLSSDFVLPEGLFGGNSASFILPKGMPKPRGSQSHCEFLSYDQIPFQVKPAPRVSGECRLPGFEPAADIKVYAAGGYSGSKLDMYIDDSGHAATLMQVTVNAPGDKVALMLSAYEPSVWHVSWTEGTQIAAVLVSGYHEQHLSGVPESVPVQIGSFSNGDGCPRFYVSNRVDELISLNGLAKQYFNKNLDQIYYTQGGKAVAGKPLRGNELVESAEAPEPAQFAKP